MEKVGGKQRFQKFGKYAFTVFVVFHIIKGTLTTAFIWAPMAYFAFYG